MSKNRENKYFGEFGGQYVAESLMNTLEELEKAFDEAVSDSNFINEYKYYLKEYVGRETPLYYAKRLSEKYGATIYLKREDLNHTGAHKINNVIGQILLAKRMGKTKIIAETGAGQHGVATATGAALFNMECTIYMGKEDIERQKLNVFRMQMLGATVLPVTTGSATLKDATNEAIRTWAERAEDTFYVLGSAVGPYPYPKIVKEFQRIISTETKRQILEKEGKLPDAVVACVGGGSNSIGMFADFIDEKEVDLIGVEAGGLGIETGKHASAMALGQVGVLHGMKTYLLQDDDGNIQLATGSVWSDERSHAHFLGRTAAGLIELSEWGEASDVRRGEKGKSAKEIKGDRDEKNESGADRFYGQREDIFGLENVLQAAHARGGYGQADRAQAGPQHQQDIRRRGRRIFPPAGDGAAWRVGGKGLHRYLFRGRRHAASP